MQPSPARFPLWTRHSGFLLGGFLLTILLIIYIWWPLAVEYLAFVPWDGPWWIYLDWLLIGIFFFMSLTIIAGADLRRDALIVFVGAFGGLVIEAWGTQTNLWTYYTAERPPLWIIPAWPIASLSIDRIERLLDAFLARLGSPRTAPGSASPAFRLLYWLIFAVFLALLFHFVLPTFNKTYTLLACLLCILLIVTPTDHRKAALLFIAGAGLGWFLERWGTTRECWTYYTAQTPPPFAVMAHGMASVAFWRTGRLIRDLTHTLRLRLATTTPLPFLPDPQGDDHAE